MAQHAGLERADELCPLGGDLFERRAQALELGGHGAAVGIGRLLFGRQLAFGPLGRGRQFVGFDHPLEDLVFERLDLALRKLDFLLDGVIFLVRLYGHRRFAELGEPALMDGHLFLDRAAGGLIFRQPLFGGRDVLARRFEPGLEGLLALRFFGEPAPGVVRRRVEFLQRDDGFEVFIHVGQQQKRPR